MLPVLLLAIGGSWMILRDGETTVDVGGDRGDVEGPVVGQASGLGEFVWPFPARDYADLDELVDGFAKRRCVAEQRRDVPKLDARLRVVGNGPNRIAQHAADDITLRGCLMR